jgi:hypothetical protein
VWQISGSSAWSDAALNMTTLPEMRDLAQRLHTYEANAGNTSEPMESTTLRVYEKLRQSLGELAGAAGFQSLASRALTLARSEVPTLSAVQVAADGNLEGLSAIELPTDIEKDRVHEGGVILISRLLGLLRIFLGEALTMNLVRDLWPDAALDDCNSENGRKA